MSGHVDRVKLPSGTVRWRARWIEQGTGKERARNFGRKIDAQQHLDSVTVAVGTGTYTQRERGQLTVGEYVELWKAGKRWEDTTRARNEAALANYVLPRWGTTSLADVDRDAYAAWVVSLSAPQPGTGKVRAAASVVKVHQTMHGLMESAVLSRRIPANPCHGVAMPKPTAADRARRKRKDEYRLSVEQIERLAGCAGRHAVIIRTLAYLGLRWEDLAGLQVWDLDPDAGLLWIRRGVVEVNGGRLVWKMPKDDEEAELFLPAQLLTDLVEHVATLADRSPGAPLFPAPGGGVLRNRNARRGWFDRAATDAGLPGLTPHHLRSTNATVAVSSGASVKAVQMGLRHDSPMLTLGLYAGTPDADRRDLAQRLDRLRAQGAAQLSATGTDTSGTADVHETYTKPDLRVVSDHA